ncbi:putative nucleotide-binding protein [Methylobacter tundripaludum]|uniref:Putative nucleotide-binding protein n=1 Tax=Methylobacter tundripaludum TaxID=173365 RepID=A0A2S6HG47_9GAMM|nr:nucleotide-binding protein [Methylobacter tundripaludum]PPK76442.1 putative nucleotide-binding protein [Methylobacter tundripaludum]
MFNLLISGNSESWNSSPFELERSRAAVEYTADEISERYKFFDEKAIQELKSFPSLFVIENEALESRIGYIINIRVRQNSVVIDFEFDPILPCLKIGAIEDLRVDIDLGKWELSRTHWVIKDEPIFEILVRKGYISQEQFDASLALKEPSAPVVSPVNEGAGQFNSSQVFIVHGHDEIAKLEMADFITSLGLTPIILHMQPSSGRTIIEKIEYYSNVGFGIVLYTPCDVGSKVGDLTGKYRARQNVVFEHGYLIGKLGRPRVVAVVKSSVETPNDISGVVYVSLDEQNIWKETLKTEMRSVGYQV